MTKICSKCKQQLPLSSFWKNIKQSDGYNNYCKKCLDEYRKKNLSRRNERAKKRRNQKRKWIINYYGGKCVCCGESEYKFLSFDHINGGGTKHKILVGRSDKFLNWIINNHYPQILQVLCHNCNQAKGAWGRCPHELER